MNFRGQGGIEFLLIVGAAILVVAIVIGAITTTAGVGKTEISSNDTNQVINPLRDLAKNTDTTIPIITLTGSPVNWQNIDATATVICTDESSGSGCNTTSYKLKSYLSNPTTCSTTYSDYDLPSPQTITSHLWICGTGKDNASNTGFTTTPIEFKINKTVPITTDNVTSGWYNTNTSIPLICSSSVGCANTYYTTDGSTPSTSSQVGNTISLTTEGVYQIKYFSIDIAGNSELPKTATSNAKLDKTAPATITNLTATTGTNNGEINLTFTAPIDLLSGLSPTPYTLKYSTSPITTDAQFNSATTFNGTINPTTIITGLTPGTTYYFAIKTTDNANNTSLISNNPNAVAKAPPTALLVIRGNVAGVDLGFFRTALTNNGFTTTEMTTVPTLSQMNTFSAIVWIIDQGNSYGGCVQNLPDLASYVQGGGKLIFNDTSQDGFYRCQGATVNTITTYKIIHAAYVGDYINPGCSTTIQLTKTSNYSITNGLANTIPLPVGFCDV
ncbi:MAG: chitobiase/beta-hexosaminidase C-terminal domain-containing protein, partial [archaeon]